MKNVLVTGGKGQLATSIKAISNTLDNVHFIFVDVEDLDITNTNQVNNYFKSHNITHCVNCAAYTAVDKAENEKEMAMLVNNIGAKNLALACNTNNAKLIQISTDFVFDGKKSNLYNEKDDVEPLSVYGETKLKGELAIANILKEHYIIRTSWLYSEYGHNFVKTMLTLAANRDELSIVCDQIGTPTYAGDLAALILLIITEDNKAYGVYHYSNEGVASWYDFAKAIFEESEVNVKVLPIKTEQYPTPATRPAFSVLDKTKIKQLMKIEIPYWRSSLKNCIANLEG
ncbi:dTDP-4-dehydrorhamnose reductase [Maribacter sp. LLG6340-A2]|uniref:dTDP-4-dehydrorhamnose reductase n=1 Tax=Maribacter sp. LLG6340-A2 TaxID=3160834 RepID=UPI003862F538